LAIQDTIRRLRHASRLIDISESSDFVKITDAFLSLSRSRLEESIIATKKVLSDWAFGELDNWWGTILSIERIEGVDDVDEFLADSTYVSRIRRFMEAANGGQSMESVRMAAEAGSGVPVRIKNIVGRLILEPLEDVTPLQIAGMLRAARRVAPARAVMDVNIAENYSSERVKFAWSPSVYVGEHPGTFEVSGTRFDTENYAIYASSDLWDRSGEDTILTTDGLPNNVLSGTGGAWHIPNLGFGRRVTLNVSTQAKPLNHLKMAISAGQWNISASDDGGEEIFSQRVISASTEAWREMDILFPNNEFRTTRFITLDITQGAQESRSLFVRSLYIGGQVTPNNRINWLAEGGLEGEREGGKDVITGDGSSLYSDEEGTEDWISTLDPDSASEKVVYTTLGGVPQKVEALGIKTSTPGCLFRIAYTNDSILAPEDFENANWRRVSGIYEMKNGRVKVSPFTGTHVRLTITNLRPLLMKDFEPSIEEG
jgi:hypothetical protein